MLLATGESISMQDLEREHILRTPCPGGEVRAN